MHAAIRRVCLSEDRSGNRDQVGARCRRSGRSRKDRLPVAAGVDAIGCLGEERHQGLRVPGHARINGHPADVPAGHYVR